MRRFKRIMILGLLFAYVLAALAAQPKLPVVRIEPFTGDALPESELRTFERLIVSYIGELKTFRVIDSGGQEMAIREAEAALLMGSDKAIEPLAADFILTGKVGKIAEIYSLILEITKVSSGETRSSSKTGQGINDLVIKSRSLTYSLFDRAVADASSSPGTTPPGAKTAPGSASPSVPGTALPTASPSYEAVRNPTLDMVEGQWKGDRSVDRFRIFRNGTGLAFLSNRVTMKIRILVENDIIIIVQDQPNSASFYQAPGISFDTARKAASQARPMRWILSLDESGNILFGRKETITISVSGDAVSVDNGFVRESILERMQ
ncbi:MAG: hypothetical protein NT080_14700 [Spirochaetes bacterium]|nr:hypothetical protein [Spirochaetota bacterium]